MKHLMLLLSMVLITGIMTGCKSDGDGLNGVYAEIDGSGYGYSYYFVNDNTVKWCYCHDGYKAPTSQMIGYTNQIGKSSLYSSNDNPSYTYTYVYEDGKVYIPEKGTILTKSGNSLTEGGHTYRKY